MISNRGLNVWNILVCKLIVRMKKSQKPQEATNILIIDENMGKHRIEALEFPKLRQQDASTSLKSILGKLEHNGITKQHAHEKMASFTAVLKCMIFAVVSVFLQPKTCIRGDKCFNPGDKWFIDQLNTERDFQLTNNCKIIFQFVNVEYNEV